jgi:hypothetical protein
MAMDTISAILFQAEQPFLSYFLCISAPVPNAEAYLFIVEADS